MKSRCLDRMKGVETKMEKNKDVKSVSIRIPSKLLKQVHYVADYEGRSANSQVLYLIRKCVHEFKDEHGEIEIGDQLS